MAKIHDIRAQTKRTNDTRKISAIKKIARHHSATTSGDFFAFWKTWNGVKGWGTGGYHEIILRDGSVQLCYDPEEITNGVGGHNGYIYNICVVGNSSFTAAQEKTWRERCLLALKRFGLSVNDVLGHNEFSGTSTTCPGIDMNKVRRELKQAQSGQAVEKPEPLPSNVLGTVEVVTASLNVRTDSNAGAKIIKALKKGDVYRAYKLENGWYNLGGGQWVNGSSSFVRFTKNPTYKEPPKPVVPVSKPKEEPTVAEEFRTVSPSHKEAWEWAEKEGLLNGEKPGGGMTREQFATVQKRIEDRKEEMQLTADQRKEYAAIFKLAREKGVFTSAAHEAEILDGTMKKSRFEYLQMVISGAALNGGQRAK